MVATRCNLLEAMEKERPVRDLNLHCLINHQDLFPDPTIEKHRSKCTVDRVLRAAKRRMQKVPSENLHYQQGPAYI
ncbi:hypothetical protein Ancab_004858 [Ancistrocladus abbreviatus]